MGFLRNIFDSIFAPAGAFDDSSSSHFDAGTDITVSHDVARDFSKHDEILVNPTTGLPMMSGVGSVDVAGHTWCEPTYSTSSQDSSSSWSHDSMFDLCSSFNAPSSWESPSMDFSCGAGSSHWDM